MDLVLYYNGGMIMDKALRDKFKDAIIVTIVLAGGWYAFPSIWNKIGINSDVLGRWRFLLYAFLLQQFTAFKPLAHRPRPGPARH